MHGRHFTFKSIISHNAVTLVPPSVTGAFVSVQNPYAIQGPWLQVLLPDNLAERMASEFQILNNPEQVRNFIKFDEDLNQAIWIYVKFQSIFKFLDSLNEILFLVLIDFSFNYYFSQFY